MERLLTPDVLGIIIQTVGAIIVAIVTKTRVKKVKSAVSKRQGKKRATDRADRDYLGWGLMGVTGVIAFILIGILIGILYDVLTPQPTVAITSPLNGQQIEVQLAETGSCSFYVRGTSSGVTSDSKLQIYVLLHPSNPSSPGWWFQIPPTPANVNQDGQWSVLVWYGSEELPPRVGNAMEVVAVVTTAKQVGGRYKVDDLKQLTPEARSDFITVSIGAIQQ